MWVRCTRLGILALMLLVGALGCGGGLVPVTGVVTLDGRPVEGAMVLFVPEDHRGQPAQGVTAADGTFSLSTGMEPGAAPGDYKVLVTKTSGTLPPGADPSSSGSLKSLLPTVYGDAQSTPFHQQVPPAGKVVARASHPAGQNAPGGDRGPPGIPAPGFMYGHGVKI